MDNRAKFANSVLTMLYNSHNGDIESDQFKVDLEEQYNYFHEYVRNIYETFSDDISLFLYHDYLNVRDVDDIYCERFEDMSIDEVLESLKKEIHIQYGNRT